MLYEGGFEPDGESRKLRSLASSRVKYVMGMIGGRFMKSHK